eukprot:Opistho-1_new@34203
MWGGGDSVTRRHETAVCARMSLILNEGDESDPVHAFEMAECEDLRPRSAEAAFKYVYGTPSKAFLLFRRSAEGGCAAGHACCGDGYKRGLGVLKNIKRARVHLSGGRDGPLWGDVYARSASLHRRRERRRRATRGPGGWRGAYSEGGGGRGKLAREKVAAR